MVRVQDGFSIGRRSFSSLLHGEGQLAGTLPWIALFSVQLAAHLGVLSLQRFSALLRLIYPARTTGLKSVKALGRQPGGTHLHILPVASLQTADHFFPINSVLLLKCRAQRVVGFARQSSHSVASLQTADHFFPINSVLLLKRPGSARGRLRPAE